MILDYKTAKDKLLASDINGCQRFFKENGCIVESAYCELLSDNIESAKTLFENASEYNIRADWGLFLCKLIQGYADKYPTYLQLRNFLEIDIDILIKNAKGQYVQNILKYSDWLASINPEVLKFIGRVLIVNGLEEHGRMFLQHAKDYFYQDPELHYLLAVECLKQNDSIGVLKAINACLDVLPGYFPAISLKRRLNITDTEIS